jgi:hypothetical protein
MLSPWPIRLPLWKGASDTFDPVWSLWYSSLVKEVNGPEPLVYASLPRDPRVGDFAIVSDSNTAVWGAVIAGLGVNQVLAWFNGVAWTVVAK